MLENTKLAIIGVIGVAVLSIVLLPPATAKEVILVAIGGLIGFIARGKDG